MVLSIYQVNTTSKVRAIYSENVDTQFKSEWSDIREFIVPYQNVNNFTVTSFNKDGIEDVTDVSYITLNWDSLNTCNLQNDVSGITIPSSFQLIRKFANHSNNFTIDYTIDIPFNQNSYIDNIYPLGEPTCWPRIYSYDLSTNYIGDTINSRPSISIITPIPTPTLNTSPQFIFYSSKSGIINLYSILNSEIIPSYSPRYCIFR